VLNGRTRVGLELLASLLEAWKVPAADQQMILDSWRGLNASPAPGPPGAGRLDEATARDLGVRAAIQVRADERRRLSLGDLTGYVERDFDGELRELIKTGTTKGAFVLLLGGSSCGKTRSLFEAVTASVPGEWWLAQPDTTQEIHELARHPTENTVLWLDEFQRFLSQDPPLRKADIIALRKSGLIVVGTVWPKQYHSRKRLGGGDSVDPFAEDRRLIDLSQVIRVADTLSAAELARAREIAPTDPRVETALTMVESGFTQVLTAAPDLVDLWEQPPTPYCRAALSAAADARRIGAQGPLVADVLNDAMAGYLTGPQRAQEPPTSWLDRALQDAELPHHGGIFALVRDDSDLPRLPRGVPGSRSRTG
jgi:hypothetical protein